MKCPKCHYLGFETGDRCKNCGYDFSLLAVVDAAPDLALRGDEMSGLVPQEWLDEVDRALGAPRGSTPPVVDESSIALPAAASNYGAAEVEPLATGLEPSVVDAAPLAAAAVQADPIATTVEPASDPASVAPLSPARSTVEPPLPLFARAVPDDDEPLIKLPPQPRPPLSVRRAPEARRLRAIGKPSRRTGAEGRATAEAPAPALVFPEETPDAAPAASRAPSRGIRPSIEASPAGRRVLAAVIDHAILLAIDLVVVYFTLRMAALSIGDWRLLPPVPLLAFLVMLKLGYFFAFTAVGGQTIGKMAAGIRVVAEDGRAVEPSRAARRALAGTASTLALGLGFVLGLVGAERRALHDRLAGTRVVVDG